LSPFCSLLDDEAAAEDAWSVDDTKDANFGCVLASFGFG